jgi:hypothetical protein
MMALFEQKELLPLLFKTVEALPQQSLVYWKIIGILDAVGAMLADTQGLRSQHARVVDAFGHYKSMADVKNLPAGKLFSIYDELVKLSYLLGNKEEEANYKKKLEALERDGRG